MILKEDYTIHQAKSLDKPASREAEEGDLIGSFTLTKAPKHCKRSIYEEENVGASLLLCNFSRKHSWILYVRRVREISAGAANSENDMISWDVVE